MTVQHGLPRVWSVCGCVCVGGGVCVCAVVIGVGFVRVKVWPAMCTTPCGIAVQVTHLSSRSLHIVL